MGSWTFGNPKQEKFMDSWLVKKYNSNKWLYRCLFRAESNIPSCQICDEIEIEVHIFDDLEIQVFWLGRIRL